MGLAALTALYVSHAREVTRLREWASRGPERTRRRVTTRPARLVAVVLAGLLVIGGVATCGDDKSGKAIPKHAAVKPGHVTVAVLNGTTVPGLAATLRDRIGAAGFKQGTIDVYSDQQLAQSVVQYATGHQDEAKAVGRRLGISRREPATAGSRARAGEATVIVIAGADKAP
jgi:LytR cell envelope-related transcriptional attenuator